MFYRDLFCVMFCCLVLENAQKRTENLVRCYKGGTPILPNPDIIVNHTNYSFDLAKRLILTGIYSIFKFTFTKFSKFKNLSTFKFC